jgi:hypothetical protein
MTEFVKLSDVTAALVGSGWSTQFGGSIPMVAGQALVVSVIARIASSNPMFTTAVPSLNSGQKNQLIVSVLSAIAAYVKKGGAVRGAMSGTAIDLIATTVLTTLNIPDMVLIGTATETTGGL